MRACLLGTAAGGGLPQWNCACAMCIQARQRGGARTQDCLAVTGAGEKWYLVNASPDIRAQILATPELAAGPGRRETPVAGALLTDAELDHTIGLLMLREGSPLEVYGPAPVLDALASGFPVRLVLGPYGSVSWHEVRPGTAFILDEQLSVTVVPLSAKRPRYIAAAQTQMTEGAAALDPWVVGYRFDDLVTGGSLVYAPCLAAWTEPLSEALTGATCVVLDGTFFRDDEMLRATGQDRPACSMGHLPITHTCPLLRACPAARRLYTHLNNTNPALAAHSPERAMLAAAGIEVAHDGLMLDL
ncbi:MAG TPA: pyrroloquinoline quinone biosynthesis protein PqqB [Streptosporangiaceae bacterium]|nr:pyrroloquinoline quinone biosynthesis protein PqqB [Streptosporangiaceae bacterium]